VIGPPPITCESPGCNQVRTACNHWYAVRVIPGRKFEIWKWEAAVAAKMITRCAHFCGQTHALQFVSSEMGAKPVQLMDAEEGL
jgi:hypothetical protein